MADNDTENDLQSLLDRVLMADPVESAGELAGFLAKADLESLNDERLAQLLEQLEPVVERTAVALRRGLRQSPLPMTERARSQLDALFDLYRATQGLDTLRIALARHEGDGERLAAAYLRRVESAARLMLDCYTLYVSVPQPLLADLHQFARTATRELERDHPEANAEVRDAYIAILLLGMVNPYSLTIDEMTVLYGCLRKVAGEVRVTSRRPGGTARFVDMTGRVAPHVAFSGGQAPSNGGVYVDVERLYDENVAASLESECRVALMTFLNKLHFFLGPREKRVHDPHAGPGERSLITIGFHSVHHRLLDEMFYSVPASEHLTFSGLDWEGLERPVHGEVSRGPSIRDFKLEMDFGRKTDLDWEALPDANGNHSQQMRINEPAVWDVVNLSERGLRLHWRMADNSRAAVDELILIERDPDEEVGGLDAVVGVGVIRWVRHLDEDNRTVDMGVERLPGTWMAYFAYPADSSPQAGGTWPVLARLDQDKHIDRLIVPPEMPERSRRVTVIREEGEDINMNLERIVMVGSQLVVMEATSDRH
ncbi:MAG: hypothetical protein ACQER6_07560 [Pseudomonadota bacterium]